MDFVFILALSTLLVHEMDAIRCKEWTIIPGLSVLDEKVGFVVFILIHIPLVALAMNTSSYEHKSNIVIGLDLFMIVHLFLHLIFLNHKKNLFKDWVSWVLIIFSSAFAIVHLIKINFDTH